MKRRERWHYQSTREKFRLVRVWRGEAFLLLLLCRRLLFLLRSRLGFVNVHHD